MTEETEKPLEGEVRPLEVPPLLSNQTQMLFAMQRLKKHIFEGVDDYEAVAKRRKANKLARAQRKINRKNN